MMKLEPLDHWIFQNINPFFSSKKNIIRIKSKLQPLDLPKLKLPSLGEEKMEKWFLHRLPCFQAPRSGLWFLLFSRKKAPTLLKLIWGAQPAVLLAWRRRNQRAIVETTKNKLSEALNPDLGKISVSSDTFHASYVSKSSCNPKGRTIALGNSRPKKSSSFRTTSIASAVEGASGNWSAHWRPHELGRKGQAIAHVVWLPYAHAYASLTPLHVWLTRGTFLTWPYAKLTRERSLISSSVRIGIAYASLFPLARNHTRPSWTFELCFCSNHIIFRHLLLPTFRKLYFSFRGHRCHTNPFRELSRRIFWNKCACPMLTSIGQFWHQGLSGWHCGLGLRGPYAHLTRPLRGFHLHLLEISSWNLDPFNGSFLILPLSDLTRETLRNILSNKKLTPAYADLSFPYAGTSLWQGSYITRSLGFLTLLTLTYKRRGHNLSHGGLIKHMMTLLRMDFVCFLKQQQTTST